MLLGRGGMGEVYRADDNELRRPVALKVLPESLVGDPDRLQRFVQEARTASALNHPHLVSIYDIGEAQPAGMTRPIHFIAMELVDGETLRDQIDRPQRDLRKMLEYAMQAADALAAAHAAGIVHRDIKPENLMVAAGGYVKVLDFGLAKLRAEPALLSAASDEPTLATGTTPGIVMGTVGYMSPEQAQGGVADHRSDIFSFGCVLYEMATGARAFGGRSAVDTLHQIINVEPAPLTSKLPTAPAELQRIVAKCLAKDPEERYQSMKEVAIDLRGLRRQLDSGSAPTAVTSGAVAADRIGRPSRMWLAAGIAAVVLLAGAYAVWTNRTRETGGSLSLARITTSGNVIDATISGDGKYLAYVEAVAGRQSLWLRQVNGARPIELVQPSELGFWGIAFARDGQSVYYATKTAAQPTGALFQIPTLGGASRQLLSDIDSTVTFSPDGKQLAFYRVDLSNGSSMLMVASADGTNARALATCHPPEYFAPGFFVAPSWSPDGQQISAFVRSSASRDARLVTIAVADGRQQTFDARFADGTFTAWLPDGSGILVAARQRGTAPITGNGGQIYLQPYPSGPVRRITNDVVEYRNISVSADGNQIVTVGFDVNVRLSMISLQGGAERRLNSDRYDGALGLAWFPDGSRILYSKVSGTSRQIWTMAADGTDQREAITEGASTWPAVSPDGRTLVFASERDGQFGIWRADADGGNARRLALVTDASFVVFARDGQSVYFTSSMQGAPATYRLPVDGGTPTLVASLFERANVSPDGRRLAGIFRENPRAPLSLSILSAESGTPEKVFPNLATTTIGGSLEWTTDASAVLFTTAERFNVWRRRVEGGEPERVTNFSDLAVVRFALSPDGRSLVACRGWQLRDAFMITGFR
jgi:Tol biopolymer transport system component